MTRGEWVLLRGPLGMLGLLGFAFAVDSGSLSGPRAANEVDASRVCADLCDVSLADEPCEVFCTSCRQSSNQSNTVASEKDVVVGAKVRGTRPRACPTLCRHGLGIPRCACDFRVSGVVVSWEEICVSFCEDEDQLPGCLRCSMKNDRQNDGIEASSGSETSSVVTDLLPAPRGITTKSYIAEESDGDESLQQVIRERASEEFDWDKFCEAECKRGNGGLACRCDIIP